MFSPSVSEPVRQGTLEVAAPRAGALTTQPGGDEAEDGVGGPGFQMGGSPPEPYPVCQVCVSQTHLEVVSQGRAGRGHER